MSEQERFEAWWDEKGINSVLLRAMALTAWMARSEIDKQPQPAEDPDEWVVQDRVPVRECDRCWCVTNTEPLPTDHEAMWSCYPGQWLSIHGLIRHGTVRHEGTLHVMCRRRDLPKVEQDDPQPQKTRVRLWKWKYGTECRLADISPSGDWVEVKHDAEGFYVLETSH